jgi:hypothetical protein
VKDLVHDLPVPIDLKQREYVCVVGAGPIVEFEANGRNRAGDVDVHDFGLEIPGRAVLIVPIEEPLDGSGE